MTHDWKRLDRHGLSSDPGQPVLMSSTVDKLDEYADRIEELEGKLAKAVNALRELSNPEWAVDEPSAGWCPDHAQEYVDELEAFCNWAVEKSKDTLAELTGAGGVDQPHTTD